MFDPDAPVDYINDKNMRFNKKLEKFYGQYTEDIRVTLLFLLFLDIQSVFVDKHWIYFV